MEPLKAINESIASVILNLEDSKNLFSRNHAFSLRFNGKTITNSTGIAFKFNDEIYIITDGNIFAPYSQQTNIINNIEMIIQFNHHFSKQKMTQIMAGRYSINETEESTKEVEMQDEAPVSLS